MILMIIFTVIFSVGIGVLVYFKKAHDDWNVWGNFLLIIGAVCLLCGFGVLLAKPHEYRVFMIQYEQDMAYLQRCEGNENLTGEEIVKASEIIIETNKIIAYHKYYLEDMWIGVFTQGRIAQLSLYDVMKIPHADILTDLDIDMHVEYE